MQLLKQKNYRNKKILNHARGQRCTYNGPTCITNQDNHETTVACHLDESFAGKGKGLKAHDFAVWFGCYACHEWDGSNQGSKEDRTYYRFRAMTKTLYILFNDGIIK